MAHPTAAAVRGVIRGVGAVGSPFADVIGVYFDQASLNGALEDADFKIGLEDFGEQTEDVETHRLIITES